MPFVRWILCACCALQTLQLGSYPGEGASPQDERVRWCGVGGAGLAEVKGEERGEGRERKGVSLALEGNTARG